MIAKQKRALITGACGFVGRHATKRLLDLGYEVIAVDNLSAEGSLDPYYWPNHLNCCRSMKLHFIKADAREIFTDTKSKFDIIVHLAAIVGGRVMIETQPLAVADDLAIDASMFRWATLARPQKIIYFSSSAAYPIGLQCDPSSCRDLREDDIDLSSHAIGMPDMSYGWSKLTGEFLARMASSQYGLDVTCLRPFSGYGEDQALSYPFPAILRRVQEEESIEIWSDSIRDFIYIEDCIDGMLHFSNVVHDGSAINLGTGVATSFSGLVGLMSAAIGREDVPEIIVRDDKPRGVWRRVADTKRSSALGFTAKTDLMAGIRKCI